MKSKVLVSVMSVTSLSFVALASATDIAVPQDAPTIQAAIDLAQDGDRVLVSPGTYAEQINLAGKSITLESTDGAAVTAIDGEGNLGYVITMTSGEDVLLRGFTVTGGFGEGGSIDGPGAGPGGGMLVEGASITIENSVVTGNAGIEGGGVFITEGDAIIRESRFENNQALHGGGLYIQQGNLTVENSEFENNFASSNGGAIAIFWLTDATITDSDFIGNDCHSFGGAIYANHAEIDFDRLTIIDNGTAEEGEHGGWTVSALGGGGIYTTATNGRINASRVLNNVAFAGTGLYIAGSGTVEIINTLIAENGSVCGCGQGAVYANSSNPVLTNNTIVKNGGFFGIFTTYNAFPIVRNTIIAGQINGLDSQSPTAGNGETDVAFSLLQGNPFAANVGTGNIIVEAFPFLDAGNDFAPIEGSAAINAGDNSALPEDITTDLLGNSRIINGTVDFGAIEFGASPPEETIIGDMTGDGTVGVEDLLMLLAAWGECHGHCPADMNGDGHVDVADLMMLFANWG